MMTKYRVNTLTFNGVLSAHQGRGNPIRMVTLFLVTVYGMNNRKLTLLIWNKGTTMEM